MWPLWKQSETAIQQNSPVTTITTLKLCDILLYGPWYIAQVPVWYKYGILIFAIAVPVDALARVFIH